MIFVEPGETKRIGSVLTTQLGAIQTGRTTTVTIWDIDSNTRIVNAAACIEVNGFYSYLWTNAFTARRNCVAYFFSPGGGGNSDTGKQVFIVVSDNVKRIIEDADQAQGKVT